MDEALLNTEVANALQVVRAGGTILYPTDTLWGIGCDATNPEAVLKIFSLKKREEHKSLIALIDEPSMLFRWVREVPAVAWNLIEFAEKPLTVIYPDAVGFAKNAIAGDGSIGIRWVKKHATSDGREEFCRRLIHRFGKPLISTSANISGEETPLYFSEIAPEILKGVDYVVSLWHSPPAVRPRSSSIIKIELNGRFQFLRK